MSEKILEGMASAYHDASNNPHYSERGIAAALLWLADNVTDEMALTLLRSFNMNNDKNGVNYATSVQALSASLRKAAEAGE